MLRYTISENNFLEWNLILSICDGLQVLIISDIVTVTLCHNVYHRCAANQSFPLSNVFETKKSDLLDHKFQKNTLSKQTLSIIQFFFITIKLEVFLPDFPSIPAYILILMLSVLLKQSFVSPHSSLCCLLSWLLLLLPPRLSCY